MSALAVKEVGAYPVVVCPHAVLYQWRDALAAVGIEAAYIINYEQLLADGRSGKCDVGEWRKMPLPAAKGKRKRKRQGVWSWDLPDNAVVIFDEAHRLTGEKSDNSQLLIAATRQRIPRVLLSATLSISPLKFKALGHAFGLYSDPTDWFLWAQSSGGCKRAYFGGLEFQDRDKWATVCESLGETVDGIDTRQVKGFPESNLIPMSVPVDADLDSEYLRDLEDLKDMSETGGVEALRARQISEFAKTPAMIELTLDAVERGLNVPIFVQFRETLNEMVRTLSGKGVRVGEIHGGQTRSERALAEKRFQDNADNAVVVMASAGGTGLDTLSDIYGQPRQTLVCPGGDVLQLIQVLGRCPRENAKSPTDQLILFAEGCKFEQRIREALTQKIGDLETLIDRDLAIELI
jgi:hypothetical protein